MTPPNLADDSIETTGLRNLRDLGGLPTAGGGRTRPGVILRSEAPVAMSPDQLAALAALGLRSALDLRDEANEDVFAMPTLPPGVERLVAGITPPANPDGKGLLAQVMDGERLDYPASELADLYVQMLADNPDKFGAALGYLCDAGNHPLLIHCHAGKDRTGLVAAMALELVGVPRAAIVEDFELTTERRAAHRRIAVEPVLQGHGTEWDRVSPLFAAPAEALETSLAWIEENHGSVEQYLTGPGGLAPEAIESLRRDFVVPPSA
jgi:protein-tyrosine phosphatase